MGGQMMAKAANPRETTIKPLSLRIAERVIDTEDASTGDKNRAAFIIQRTDIQGAIDKGWSILQIWEALRNERSIQFGYQAFRRYTHQLCSEPNKLETSATDQSSVSEPNI